MEAAKMVVERFVVGHVWREDEPSNLGGERAISRMLWALFDRAYCWRVVWTGPKENALAAQRRFANQYGATTVVSARSNPIL
jgi:3'-phosphoadenosine 5'-phosphosulfate sulfotransferase